MLGPELGRFFWTYEVDGTSFVERQARDGHVPVAIDRLGYDAGGTPDGFASCLGGQADIANQIVDQLRRGDYGVRGADAAPGFERVVLGGHSVGGQHSELSAVAANLAGVGQIDVPVLVIIGEKDALFPSPAGPTQRDLFTGSDDVTLKRLSPSSHAVTVEETTPGLAAGISRWLDREGLGSGSDGTHPKR